MFFRAGIANPTTRFAGKRRKELILAVATPHTGKAVFSDSKFQIPIHRNLDIVHIHGRAGRFLEVAEGRISVNILEMARPGLKKELSAAIRKVDIHKREAVHPGIRIKHNGGQLYPDVAVKKNTSTSKKSCKAPMKRWRPRKRSCSPSTRNPPPSTRNSREE